MADLNVKIAGERIRKHKTLMLHDGHIRMCPILFSSLFDGGWWWSSLFDGGWWWLVNLHPNQKAVEAAVGSWGLLKISQDFGIMHQLAYINPMKTR